jgi:phosphoglycerate dehydrogenase-like enzyme
MIKALDEKRLSIIAHDVADAKPGDALNHIYNQLRNHPNIYTTPHIAGFSDTTTKISNDMMIDNVEAWIKGKPINIFKG